MEPHCEYNADLTVLLHNATLYADLKVYVHVESHREPFKECLHRRYFVVTPKGLAGSSFFCVFLFIKVHLVSSYHRDCCTLHAHTMQTTQLPLCAMSGL